MSIWACLIKAEVIICWLSGASGSKRSEEVEGLTQSFIDLAGTFIRLLEYF